MGNFLLPWKDFTDAAIVMPPPFRGIPGRPVSQNFGNRWVANPSMWVTPLPAWIDRGPRGAKEHRPGSEVCSLAN